MMHQQSTPETPLPEAGTGADLRTAADVGACAGRLERLTLRMSEFLNRQLAQIEDACSGLHQTEAGRAELDQRSRELHHQQLLWEQTKAEKAKRIAEEVEVLTRAWDQIEAERRRMFMEESGSSSVEPEIASSVSTPSVTTQSVSTPSVSAPSATNLPEPDPPNPANLFDVGLPGSSRSAALQFQQIKREIRQHARRNS